MVDEGLHIYRPIPRRPFALGKRSPTPPSEADDDYSPPLSPFRPYSLDNAHRAENYLDPHAFNAPLDSSSRSGSYQNLTSSTLSGIYTPTISDGFDDNDSAPPRTGRLEDSVYKVVRDRRSSVVARRRSSTVPGKSAPGQQRFSAFSLGLRTGLLFLLGMGYGALLLRVSTEQQWTSFPVDEILKPKHDGRYLVAWGLCGVVLGGLLPWFDGKWEQIVEKRNVADDESINASDVPGTDWALVIRGMGAFAGIVFAIRKIPWASTMQVSLTLAMANPLLWYLIDRSKTGFLLSSAVSFLGSIVSLGLDPEIMPAPTGYSSPHRDRNATETTGSEVLMLGGLATQHTIETGIWVVSVLFCSCVCFGNIGRRLALTRSAAKRGRWGGLR